jgi:hypothetical protein
MTTQRNWKRFADTGIGLGLILVAGIALTGAGRREPEPVTSAKPSAGSPGGEVTPGIAQADVDTLDLQLD